MEFLPDSNNTHSYVLPSSKCIFELPSNVVDVFNSIGMVRFFLFFCLAVSFNWIWVDDGVASKNSYKKLIKIQCLLSSYFKKMILLDFDSILVELRRYLCTFFSNTLIWKPIFYPNHAVVSVESETVIFFSFSLVKVHLYIQIYFCFWLNNL